MTFAGTRELEPTPHDSTVDDAKLALVGRRLDRFEVRRVIGRGGMGVVVEAHDPALDRRVALKLVDGTRAASRAGQRLVREARAMARLAHPNVVAVFEVGAVDDRVFVVMELVEGRTLGAWLDGKPSRAQILDAFAAAGAGLAAAHQAGVVHRDFKPSNVLVGDDDRVRVTDFGIALVATEPEDVVPSDSEHPAGLTRTGAAIGTPRYMAPEQRAGGEVTTQADQYAFCVALWEALFDAHPFDHDAAATVPAADVVAPIAAPRPPRGHDVPARLVAALLRGLSPEPGDRWPSMGALLRALAPRRRRRWIWLAAPVVAIAGVVAFAAGSGTPSCAEVSHERAALTSSAARRARIRAGLVATGHPAASALVDRAMVAIDRYSGRWAMAFTDGCTSARAGGAAAAASERRLACLDRHLQGLDGTLAALTTAPTRELVNRAEGVVRALPDPDECVADDGEAQPPPAIVSEVARLTRTLAEANANLDGGRVAAAEALLTTLVPEVARVGWGPLAVRTDLARAKVAMVRGTGALEVVLGAARRATTLRMDLVAAAAWTEAVRIAGKERTPAEVDMLVAIARAQAERTGAPHVIAAAAIAEGLAQASFDKPELSERTCRAAIAALGDRGDPRAEEAHTSASECLLQALIALGRMREAEVLAGEMIARWRSERPEQHPTLAVYLSLRVTALIELGRAEEALVPAEQALAIYRAALGPTHPETVDAMRDLARVAVQRGEPARAEATLNEAIALLEPVVAANEYRELAVSRRPATILGAIEQDLGNLVALRGDLVGARRHTTRAGVLLRTTFGERSIAYGGVLLQMSELCADGDPQAIELNRRARDLLLELGDREHASLASAGLGKLLAEAGRWAEARPLLEETARGFSDATPPHNRGVTLRYLAEARLKLGDRAGATTAAHDAEAAYVDGGAQSRDALDRVRAWIAKNHLAARR